MMSNVLFALLALVAANEPTRYLLVSAPRFAKVEYFKLPDKTPYPLIDAGLRSPQGLAVDHKSNTLYVADPDVRKIFGYPLAFSGDSLRTDGEPHVVAQNVEARWVAVDGVGNVFFSDELENVIKKVSADDIAKGVAHPEVIYDGAKVVEVNRPGGVAVDNFHIFWSNKAVGTQVGSVVRGSEEPTSAAEGQVTQVAKNSNKVYGVCLSQNNVYYTDQQKFMFGVKKSGGAIATVSDRLQGPRGCSWDGDSSVYVADKAAGTIYSFPGNMHNLAPAKLTKFVDFDDAFGLAVLQSSARLVAVAAALFLFA